MSSDTPQPTDIRLHQKSRVLEISFADGMRAFATDPLRPAP